MYVLGDVRVFRDGDEDGGVQGLLQPDEAALGQHQPADQPLREAGGAGRQAARQASNCLIAGGRQGPGEGALYYV